MSRRQRQINHRRKKRAAARMQAAAKPEIVQQSGEGDIVQSRADCRLVKHAMNQRWPIRDDVRPLIVNGITRIAINPEEKASTRIQAANVLAQMDRINLEDEKRSDVQQEVEVTQYIPAKERLVEIAAIINKVKAQQSLTNGNGRH